MVHPSMAAPLSLTTSTTKHHSMLVSFSGMPVSAMKVACVIYDKLQVPWKEIHVQILSNVSGGGGPYMENLGHSSSTLTHSHEDLSLSLLHMMPSPPSPVMVPSTITLTREFSVFLHKSMTSVESSNLLCTSTTKPQDVDVVGEPSTMPSILPFEVLSTRPPPRESLTKLPTPIDDTILSTLESVKEPCLLKKDLAGSIQAETIVSQVLSSRCSLIESSTSKVEGLKVRKSSKQLIHRRNASPACKAKVGRLDTNQKAQYLWMKKLGILRKDDDPSG